VNFATKGALAAGVPAEWVVGDTVYGYDELCLWLDEQQKNYVMAVPETYKADPQLKNLVFAKTRFCMFSPLLACKSKFICTPAKENSDSPPENIA